VFLAPLENTHCSGSVIRKHIVDYIEMFYNSCRAHSYLGYLSPNEYESVQQALPQAA